MTPGYGPYRRAAAVRFCPFQLEVDRKYLANAKTIGEIFKLNPKSNILCDIISLLYLEVKLSEKCTIFLRNYYVCIVLFRLDMPIAM
jgi:hypothetical protein